ncbi:hypothetical protein GGU45_000098 [Niabella hirudinis]
MTIANCLLKYSGVVTCSLEVIFFILLMAGFYEGQVHKT